MEELELVRLVELARSGDREAFSRLVIEFERSVFGIVLRRLRNRAEAAEVTQDVFMTALRKFDQLQDCRRFAGWLRRIAVRLSINRAVRRPRDRYGSDEHLAGVSSRGPGPFLSALRNEDAQQVRDGLDRLKKLDRETLVAFYFEGRSLIEMSHSFATPVGTIKRRLHTARNRLRDTLSKLQAVG